MFKKILIPYWEYVLLYAIAVLVIIDGIVEFFS